MKPNPGGEIEPKDVVGRDELIAGFWDTLTGRSINLVSERRLGKTMVLKKMHAEKKGGFITIFRDLENIKTPKEFSERIFSDALPLLSVDKKMLKSILKKVKQLGGLEIGKAIKFPKEDDSYWKEPLEALFGDLVGCQKGRIVFLWDELPYMLQNIIGSSGEEAAMEILVTLRELRQMHGSKLGMIFAGSIGFHHVFKSGQNLDNLGNALNDMQSLNLPTLSERDARYLASELIKGAKISCSNPAQVCSEVASLADCIPYYIHHIIAEMKNLNQSASAELACRIVSEAIIDPHDGWKLDHYYNRLGKYYKPDQLPIVKVLLDLLAATEHPISRDELRKGLAAALDPRKEDGDAKLILEGDQQRLGEILLGLEKDHYLTRDIETSGYRFRYSLIKRWWNLRRN